MSFHSYVNKRASVLRENFQYLVTLFTYMCVKQPDFAVSLVASILIVVLLSNTGHFMCF